MKKLLAMVVCLTMVLSIIPSSIAAATNVDYVKIFGELVDYDNNNAKLKTFLMNNYNYSSADHFQECYMVDMDNNSVPELLCLFIDDDHSGIYGYAVLVEYDNGFKMGKELPFEFNDGTGASEWYSVLEADGKFYFEKYSGSVYIEGSYVETYINQEVILNENGKKSVVYSAKLKGYNDYNKGTEKNDIYINGQKADEFDFEYVINNYNVVADSADYNFNAYYADCVAEHTCGREYSKFWNKKTPEIKVTIDGKEVVFDQLPVLINDRTMVPIRKVVEAMNGTVGWEEATQTAVLTLDETEIRLTIGSQTALLNGKPVALDVDPVVVNGRTLLPIRFVAEKFGYNVDWDDNTQTVIIRLAGTKAYARDLVNVLLILDDGKFLGNMQVVNNDMAESLKEIKDAIDFQENVLFAEEVLLEASDILKSVVSKDVAGAVEKLKDFAVDVGVEVTGKTIMKAIPDINAFVYNLGISACDSQEETLKNLYVLCNKIKEGKFTKKEANDFVKDFYQMLINNETSKMANILLCDELPDNWYEGTIMSLKTAADVFAPDLIKDVIGIKVNVPEKIYEKIIVEYAKYVMGDANNFYLEFVKGIGHPAVKQWKENIDKYNEQKDKILGNI